MKLKINQGPHKGKELLLCDDCFSAELTTQKNAYTKCLLCDRDLCNSHKWQMPWTATIRPNDNYGSIITPRIETLDICREDTMRISRIGQEPHKTSLTPGTSPAGVEIATALREDWKEYVADYTTRVKHLLIELGAKES